MEMLSTLCAEEHQQKLSTERGDPSADVTWYFLSLISLGPTTCRSCWQGNGRKRDESVSDELKPSNDDWGKKKEHVPCDKSAGNPSSKETQENLTTVIRH